MSQSRDLEESRSPISVVMDLIDGKAWNARLVRNNNLRQHCRILGKTFGRAHRLTDQLRPAASMLTMREVMPTPCSIIWAQ